MILALVLIFGMLVGLINGIIYRANRTAVIHRAAGVQLWRRRHRARLFATAHQYNLIVYAVDPAHGHQSMADAPLIELRNVSKSFAGGQALLPRPSQG